jgi:hypothetical protein
MTGSCEHSHELLGYIKGREFDHVNDYHVFKGNFSMELAT